MLSYLLAMFDYNVFYNSTNPVAAMVMFMIFEVGGQSSVLQV
jgi:hypothetical protein